MLKAVQLLAVAGVLVLWTGLAGESRSKAQDPGPAPAPPPSAPDVAKSVITLFDGRPVPEKWRLGFSIPLSAAKSTAGTRPESVRWYVEPAEFDAYCVRRDQGRSIDIQTGIEPVRLRVRLAVARGDTFDESTVEIQAGEKRPDPPAPPDPTPDPVGPTPPTPQPAPGPAPTDKFGKLGRDFGSALLTTYGDTMEESASMLAAGVARKAVIGDFGKRWQARREKAGEASASEFAGITPDDREPQGDEKARLVQAWRDFARGVKGR